MTATLPQGQHHDPSARPARTAQPVCDAVHLVHPGGTAIHFRVVLSGAAGSIPGNTTAARTTRQSARRDDHGRRTDVQHGRAAADDAGADVYHAPDRRGAPQPNLSLIHISEPTRLGMISYAVFCLK